jgi:predicted metal-dependent enzyme (double-stranded beta helix superfamily)
MRKDAVENLIEASRATLRSGPLNRQSLAQIRAELELLAANAELWPEDDYPPPNNDERHSRFKISHDPDSEITLYLNVMKPGKVVPPHDHTTWACVAAVSGVEFNTLYDRLDDGSVPGVAELEVRETLELAPGKGVALMPDDIHSVEIRGREAIRHLHFYGRPLETLSERTQFDLATGTCKIMDIGVKTKGRGSHT